MSNTSEARIKANQQNALKSTGPRTEAGKDISRRNALKHGLTGEGVALCNEDAAEVDRRFVTLEAELRPVGELGRTLVRRAALFSVRMDRGVSHETATLSERIRRAEADFVAPEGMDAREADHLRAEAGSRAMFDPSKEATLARKYEAAAERGFFRCLKELRLLARGEKGVGAPSPNNAIEEALGSFRQLSAAASAMGMKLPEPPRAVASKPVVPAQTSSLSPAVGRVDVPFSIGKAR